jgi:hypothetical protein
MADPQPCQKCRKLVTRNKHERLHDTLEPMKRRPDIGHVPDIGREAEYQCVICETILTCSRNTLFPDWRFGE